jgi:hypothetical protein
LSGKGSAALAAIGRASSTPFFSASKTGGAAARHVVRELGPVTLVNLSNLRSIREFGGPHKEVEADAARLSGKGSAALAAIGRASFSAPARQAARRRATWFGS